MIEVTVLISVMSLATAMIVGFMGLRRNTKKDDREESAETATVIVKLENIGSDVKEIKSDIKGMKEDLQSLDRRVTRIEESVKSAHHRIDTMEMHKGESAYEQ